MICIEIYFTSGVGKALHPFINMPNARVTKLSSILQTHHNLFYFYSVTWKCEGGWYLYEVCLWWGDVPVAKEPWALFTQAGKSGGRKEHTTLYYTERSNFGRLLTNKNPPQ